MPELPRAAWSTPIRRIDSTSITVVPIVKHETPHDATSRYADLYWAPIIGGDALALLRWVSHQERPITMSNKQLAVAIGAPGSGQTRRAIATLIDNGLATATGTALHVDITLPGLTRLQANKFGPVFAERHRADPAKQLHAHA